jgi:hypothetical protein
MRAQDAVNSAANITVLIDRMIPTEAFTLLS